MEYDLKFKQMSIKTAEQYQRDRMSSAERKTEKLLEEMKAKKQAALAAGVKIDQIGI